MSVGLDLVQQSECNSVAIPCHEVCSRISAYSRAFYDKLVLHGYWRENPVNSKFWKLSRLLDENAFIGLAATALSDRSGEIGR